MDRFEFKTRITVKSNAILNKLIISKMYQTTNINRKKSHQIKRAKWQIFPRLRKQKVSFPRQTKKNLSISSAKIPFEVIKPPRSLKGPMPQNETKWIKWQWAGRSVVDQLYLHCNHKLRKPHELPEKWSNEKHFPKDAKKRRGSQKTFSFNKS